MKTSLQQQPKTSKKRSLSDLNNNEDKEKWTVRFLLVENTPLFPLSSVPTKDVTNLKHIVSLRWNTSRGNIKKTFSSDSIVAEGMEKKESAKRFKGLTYYQHDRLNISSTAISGEEVGKKKEITITIPQEKCNSERELSGFVNILNGHDRSSIKSLGPREHVNCILLADYLGVRIVKG